MLKKLLSKNDCSKCRFCCVFDETDYWELPLMSDDTVDFIKSTNNSACFEKIGEMFRLIPDFNTEGFYSCAALNDNGCTLSDDLKPFDCKIWPFRVMRKDNCIVLALSDGCKTINSIDEEKVKLFVDEGFGDIIFHFANEHPEIIKDYIDGYTIYKIANF